MKKHIEQLGTDIINDEQYDVVESTEEGNETNDMNNASLKQGYSNYIMDNNLFYIHVDNAYAQYFPDEDDWLTLKTSSMSNVIPTLSKVANKNMFSESMIELGRNYTNVTYTFNPLPIYTLNKLNRNIWLEPEADYSGDVNDWFLLLMYSLGGGKQENIEHIEQVLIWKYLHPEDYQLPCMVIYGNGGVGKNLLTDKVLKTVFSKNQAVTITMDRVTGNFNSQLAGKTVIFIDEAVAEKSDMNSLKNIVSNPYITINEKFTQPYVADNTALYITGGNSLNGAIRLGDDDSDRRWSIIRARDSLNQCVMKAFEVDSIKAKAMIGKAVDEVFTNPAEISKWIAYLIEKYSDMAEAPKALHGEDFNELLSKQSGPFQHVMLAVFNDPAFTYISGKTLWHVYQQIHREEVPTGNVGGKSLFESKVDAWLVKNNPSILHNKSINVLNEMHKPSTTAGYISAGLRGRQENTDIRYINGEGVGFLPDHKADFLSVVADKPKSKEHKIFSLMNV